MKRFLEIGQIVGTHGIKGEMRVQPWCDSYEFFAQFNELFLDDKGEKAVEILSSRPHGNVFLITLLGVNDADTALHMRSKVLYMDRNKSNIAEGTYFIQDLIGCAVIDSATGQDYGKISEVSNSGASDLWHIMRDGKEYLLPAIPDVVDTVDVNEMRVTITPIKGLLDDDI